MGTNYYAVRNRPSVREPIHIGKSSAGWLFHFQEQYQPWNDPPVLWYTYDDVKDWLLEHTVTNSEYVIMDEYDEIIPFSEFIDMIDAKQNDPRCRNNPDNFMYCKNVGGYRFDRQEFS